MSRPSAPAAPASTAQRPVYLIDGARTPFLKARGRPGPFSPVDLAVQCGRPLLLRQDFPAQAFDQVILGCVNVLSSETNPARIAALRLGLGAGMRAFTVQINCGSGMQSIDTAFRSIRNGDWDLVLAGGTEALSQTPLLVKAETATWLADLRQADSLAEQARTLGELRPAMLAPVPGLLQGLTDPICGLSMGQTAELLGHLFAVDREQADRYALESHRRLARAQAEGWLAQEIEPAITPDGELFERDDGVRPETSLEALAQLPPVFEPPYGRVTAGNSSQVSDGASWVILASERALERYRLKPRARLLDSEWSALDPRIMGLAPVLASSALLRRQGLRLADIDLWELNEAFAAQVLACQAAWDDAEFCRRALGLEQPPGRIDPQRLNCDGGAIALGHPVAASGNRIVLHLIQALGRQGGRLGLACECIGGGQAGAMLIENLGEEAP